MRKKTQPALKPRPYTLAEFGQDMKASLPFLTVHAGCLLVLWAGFSWTALAVCLALYVVRMFGITAGFHRYFSHRTFKTSRWFQCVLGLLGTSAGQRGPLWWAAHHRHHHRHSDTEEDSHSPRLQGFLWSHLGWIFSHKSTPWAEDEVRDLMKYPELRWMTRFHFVVPIALAGGLYGLGVALSIWAPALGVTGLQMLAWGFFVSTTLLYHGTFTINSLSHVYGHRSYETTDDSKNNWFLALLTLGEGWHNNHHRYPGSERQGFFWWQIDIAHYVLRGLATVRIVWDLRQPPREVLEEAVVHRRAREAG